MLGTLNQVHPLSKNRTSKIGIGTPINQSKIQPAFPSWLLIRELFFFFINTPVKEGGLSLQNKPTLWFRLN